MPPQVVREQINEVRFRSARVPDRSFFTFARPVARRLGAQLGRARGLRRVPREGDVGVEELQGRDEAEQAHEQPRAALHVLAALPEAWL